MQARPARSVTELTRLTRTYPPRCFAPPQSQKVHTGIPKTCEILKNLTTSLRRLRYPVRLGGHGDQTELGRVCRRTHEKITGARSLQPRRAPRRTVSQFKNQKCEIRRFDRVGWRVGFAVTTKQQVGRTGTFLTFWPCDCRTRSPVELPFRLKRNYAVSPSRSVSIYIS